MAAVLTQCLGNLKGPQGKGGKGGGTCFPCGGVGRLARERPTRSLADGQRGHSTLQSSEVSKPRTLEFVLDVSEKSIGLINVNHIVTPGQFAAGKWATDGSGPSNNGGPYYQPIGGPYPLRGATAPERAPTCNPVSRGPVTVFAMHQRKFRGLQLFHI